MSNTISLFSLCTLYGGSVVTIITEYISTSNLMPHACNNNSNNFFSTTKRFLVFSVRCMYVSIPQKPAIRYRSPVALNIAEYTNIYQTYARMRKKKQKTHFCWWKKLSSASLLCSKSL